MKKIIALLLTMIMVLSLAACGSGNTTPTPTPAGNSQGNDKEATPKPTSESSTPAASDAQNVNLKIWVPEEAVEDTNKFVKQFDELHPEFNIQYEIAIVGIDEAPAMVETDADTAADLFYVPSGGVADMVTRGLLLPLVKGYEAIENDLPEAALTATTFDGIHYAAPFASNTYFMYYNKDFYTEEEIKSLEAMMAKDFGEGKYNFSTQITNSWYAESFFFANGCLLFGPDGRDASVCTFNDANGLAAGEYMIDLVNNSKYLENADGVGGSFFRDGNLGAITDGAWSAPFYKDALGDKLGAAPLPTINIGGSDKHLSNFVDFKTICVKSNTEYPLAAQQLAVYLVSEEASLSRFKNQGDVPILKSLNGEIADDYVAAALNGQVAYATNQPNIPQMGGYWVPMKAFGDGVYSKEITKENLQSNLNSLVSNITSTLTN